MQFLTLTDLEAEQIQRLLARSIELKQLWRAQRKCPQIMTNRTLALVFEKSSTRTRVSFEVAANHFGGRSLFLNQADSQLQRGESAEDTARVLSSMVDIVVTRTAAHATAAAYARLARVPVINGLSDACHPCQLLADLLTLTEIRTSLRDLKVAWIGDGNNMCVTWAMAASLMRFHLKVCTPPAYAPRWSLVSNLDSSFVEVAASPMDAAAGADAVVTDSWISMGQEQEKQQRMQAFEDFQVTSAVMACAAKNAVFMHCLPAYRGLEVAAQVIDGPQSVVWQEAENRLHAQKALIELLLQ